MLRVAYHEALDATRADVTRLGTSLTEALADVMRALDGTDRPLAGRVIADSDAIEDLRRRIEASCIDLIWRQQPVASELRRVAGMFEICEDYERITHYVVEIAKHAIRLHKSVTDVAPARDAVTRLAEETFRMLDEAARSFRENDADLARSLVSRDDTRVDELYHAGLTALQDAMREDPQMVGPGSHMMFVLADFQRISEHAISVAWHTTEILGER